MAGDNNGKDLVTVTAQHLSLTQVLSQQIAHALDDHIAGAESDLLFECLEIIQHQVQQLGITITFHCMENALLEFIHKALAIIETGQ